MQKNPAVRPSTSPPFIPPSPPPLIDIDITTMQTIFVYFIHSWWLNDSQYNGPK